MRAGTAPDSARQRPISTGFFSVLGRFRGVLGAIGAAWTACIGLLEELGRAHRTAGRAEDQAVWYGRQARGFVLRWRVDAAGPDRAELGRAAAAFGVELERCAAAVMVAPPVAELRSAVTSMVGLEPGAAHAAAAGAPPLPRRPGRAGVEDLRPGWAELEDAIGAAMDARLRATLWPATCSTAGCGAPAAYGVELVLPTGPAEANPVWAKLGVGLCVTCGAVAGVDAFVGSEPQRASVRAIFSAMGRPAPDFACASIRLVPLPVEGGAQ